MLFPEKKPGLVRLSDAVKIGLQVRGDIHEGSWHVRSGRAPL